MRGGTRLLAGPGNWDWGLSPRARGNPIYELSLRTGEWAYPRVRGGTAMTLDSCQVFSGLSPRARGNHEQEIKSNCTTGPIPACAGEPLMVQSMSLSFAAYPRVRGGTVPDAEQRANAMGLSPRARGNPPRSRAPGAGAGPIPACAGEPPRRTIGPFTIRAYPRVRGGTAIKIGSGSTYVGLSPRARGNLLGSPLQKGAAGPIPACAGEPIALRLH